ncbi:MAG TPA: sugar phosphate isomerase/epimerase [Polyangiaceae bacterium]|nr:sugar phosphate isomerase/epimerase [Polyangiaceae bacterium]
MKLGFLTACLPGLSLETIAAWADAHGYDALEVAAWPSLGERPFTATHIAAERLDAADVERIHALTRRYKLTLSSLAYYDNNLHPDREERARVHAHLRCCIDAAAALGVPTVGTFVGRDPTQSVANNLREAERIFRPLVQHAGERGVKIVIENCVMEGWHPDGYPGNLAYSPELWEWMFDLGLYLNFDPSHLVWLGIDPVAAVRPYLRWIPHAQAKDIECFGDRRNRYGFYGKMLGRKNAWDLGWWRYRVPGLGEVDWRRLVDALYEGGFEGVLSVEHEDPVWGGTESKVKTGLEIAHRTLSPLIVDEH